MYVPHDWATDAIPHGLTTYTITIFGKKMLCCTCGLTAIGRDARKMGKLMWDLHIIQEKRMVQWLSSLILPKN